MQTTTLYEQDFYTWTQRQAELLRAGQLGELDVETLIEEIESLGRQERQELRHRLEVLLGICSSVTTSWEPALKVGSTLSKRNVRKFSVTLKKTLA